ncbi:hypothetical protein TWF696_005295 [Orbilia brochopaga]|uniref:Uncharacterized protein n=1 Tax=Orbilia brochopaga TaxID=3140254 RepID=A0AAV9V1C0_9PEZI
MEHAEYIANLPSEFNIISAGEGVHQNLSAMYINVDWIRIAGQGALPFLDDTYDHEIPDGGGSFLKAARQLPPPPSPPAAGSPPVNVGAAPPAGVPPPVALPPANPAAAPAQQPAPPTNQPPVNAPAAANPQPPSGWTAPSWMPAGAQAAADELADDPAPFGSDTADGEPRPVPINLGADFSASDKKISSNHGAVHVWNTGTGDLVAGIVALVIVASLAVVAIIMHKRRCRAIAAGKTFPQDGWDANAIAAMIAGSRAHPATITEGIPSHMTMAQNNSSTSSVGTRVHRSMLQSHIGQRMPKDRLHGRRSPRAMSRTGSDVRSERSPTAAIAAAAAAAASMRVPAGMSTAKERYYRSRAEKRERRARLLGRSGRVGDDVLGQSSVVRV